MQRMWHGAKPWAHMQRAIQIVALSLYVCRRRRRSVRVSPRSWFTSLTAPQPIWLQGRSGSAARLGSGVHGDSMDSRGATGGCMPTEWQWPHGMMAQQDWAPTGCTPGTWHQGAVQLSAPWSWTGAIGCDGGLGAVKNNSGTYAGSIGMVAPPQLYVEGSS